MFTLDAFSQKRSPTQPRIIGLGEPLPQGTVLVSGSMKEPITLPASMRPLTTKVEQYQQTDPDMITRLFGVLGTVGNDHIWKVSEENLFVSDYVESLRRRTFLGDTNAAAKLGVALELAAMEEARSRESGEAWILPK